MSPYFDDLEESPKKKKVPKLFESKEEDGYFSDLPRLTKPRSVISAGAKGAYKSAADLRDLLSFQNHPELQKAKEAEREFVHKNLPSHEGALEDIAEFAGEALPYALAGPGSLAARGGLAAARGLAKKGLKEADAPEIIQDIGSDLLLGGPELFKSIGKLGKSLAKKPVLTPSGMRELNIQGAKYPGIGTLSPERKTHVIAKMDQEAAVLTKKSLEKRFPFSVDPKKEMELETGLAARFKKLRDIADGSPFPMETSPIRDMMVKYHSRYKGIPHPNPESRKILKEISSFSSHNPSDTSSLLRIYRDNNKKISAINETAHALGKKKEYTGFLKDMNKSIADSFEKTMPKDSVWLKEFKDSNKAFSELQRAQKTRTLLKGVLSSSPTSAEVRNLAENPKIHALLKHRVGDSAANEMIQIGKDLHGMRSKIESLRKGVLSKYDAFFPLYFLIPYIGKLYGAKKTLDMGRYGYGWLLSTSKNRRAYQEALKAFSKDDLSGYARAVAPLVEKFGNLSSGEKEPLEESHF